MGLGDMNLGGFDADSARYDRQNRLNPPEFAPGQSGSPLDMGSIFPDSSVPSNTGGLGDVFSTGTGFGGGLSGVGGGMGADPFASFNSPVGMNSFGQPPMAQTQQPPKDASDKFWDTMGVGFKGLSGFVGELGKSFHGLTPLFWSKYGFKCMNTGIITGLAGVVSRLFGFPIGLKIAIGGLLAGACGTVVFLFSNEKSRQYTSQYTDDNNTDQNFIKPSVEDLVPCSADGGFNDFGVDSGTNGFDEDSDFSDEDDSDFDDFGSDDGEEDDWDSIVCDDDNDNDSCDGLSADDALITLQEVDKGMYTRQYLYEMFTKVLSHIRSSYAKVTEYSEEDDVFLYWDDIVQRAAKITGFKEDEELPTLTKLEENIFTMTLTITRLAKLKPEVIAKEIANAYAFETYDDEEGRAKVFARVDSILDSCIITIYTGASELISLKDMYDKCEDFILDNKKMMPCVLGINERGKVITLDLKKVESMIIAGMPRSGKSWFVQALLCQLCAFNSPKNLIIYVLDPKADTSDFRRFALPHIKKFAAKYTAKNGSVVNPEFPSILDTLRYVVNVEAPRRKKLIGGNGFVNISDFRSKYPDVDLPYLYIIVDEMVTLSEMEKSDEAEYQSYLSMIVTQFPNLGIRGLFIPHEVKNQIINKTAYDSVKARISVKGSATHIEESTGTKERDFKYKLGNVGDMAVNIDEISAKTIFVHGVALSDGNEKNNEIFDYLRRVWSKLEPDEVANSAAENAEVRKYHDDLIKKADSDDNDSDMNLFDEGDVENGKVFSNPNENGLSGMNDEFDLF